MTFCLHTENFKEAFLDSNRNILVIKDEILRWVGNQTFFNILDEWHDYPEICSRNIRALEISTEYFLLEVDILQKEAV